MASLVFQRNSSIALRYIEATIGLFDDQGPSVTVDNIASSLCVVRAKKAWVSWYYGVPSGVYRME
jgi:hypothetical protein